MTLMRQNPIPVGRYWIDVFAKDMSRFQTWLGQNVSTVRTETTQHFDTDPPRDWFLLNVTAPTPALGWDFLTVAGPGVQTSDDTVQKPPPEKEPEITDVIDKVAVTAGLLLGGYLLVNLISRRR